MDTLPVPPALVLPLKRYLEERLSTLRVMNDDPAPELVTARLRGAIVEVKRLQAALPVEVPVEIGGLVDDEAIERFERRPNQLDRFGF